MAPTFGCERMLTYGAFATPMVRACYYCQRIPNPASQPSKRPKRCSIGSYILCIGLHRHDRNLTEPSKHALPSPPRCKYSGRVARSQCRGPRWQTIDCQRLDESKPSGDGGRLREMKPGSVSATGTDVAGPNWDPSSTPTPLHAIVRSNPCGGP